MFFKKDDKKQGAENLPPLDLDNLQMPVPLSNNLETPVDAHIDIPSPEEFGISAESSTMNIAKNSVSEKKGFFGKIFGAKKEVAMPQMPQQIAPLQNQMMASPQMPRESMIADDDISGTEKPIRDDNIEKLDDLEKHLASYMTSLENKDNLKVIPQSISTLPSEDTPAEQSEEENKEDDSETKTHDKPSFNKVEHEQIKKKIDTIESEIDAHLKEIMDKIKIIKPLERKALEYVKEKRERMQKRRSEKKKGKKLRKIKSASKKKIKKSREIAKKKSKIKKPKRTAKKNKK